MPKANCVHSTDADSRNIVPLAGPEPAARAAGKGGAASPSAGSFARQIAEVAAIWATHRQRPGAQVLQFPPRGADAFRAPGEAAPAQPPRFPYKPPANTPPKRKPAKPAKKAADGADPSPQQNGAPACPAARAPTQSQPQPDTRIMEKARLLAELAEAWGVNLRLALAVAEGKAGGTDGQRGA